MRKGTVTKETKEMRRHLYEATAHDLFVCRECGEEKAGSQFTFDPRNTGSRESSCTRCRNTRWARSGGKSRAKKRAKDRIKAARDMLLVDGCAICGMNDKECLQIHHLNPDEKETTIAEIISHGTMKQFLAEIAKGIAVLCANCHCRVHAGTATIPCDGGNGGGYRGVNTLVGEVAA